jgi:hypothetical protein
MYALASAKELLGLAYQNNIKSVGADVAKLLLLSDAQDMKKTLENKNGKWKERCLI